MKKLPLSRLTADPLTKARAEADTETVTISGYIRSTDEDTISICEKQTSQSYVEYPRSAIEAAFNTDEKSTKVTLVVAGDAKVRTVKESFAKDVNGKKDCGCGGSDPDVKEARPPKSIHPALAAFINEVAKIKAGLGKGSIDLKCSDARTECIQKGLSTEECDRVFDECIANNLFG